MEKEIITGWIVLGIIMFYSYPGCFWIVIGLLSQQQQHRHTLLVRAVSKLQANIKRIYRTAYAPLPTHHIVTE